MEKISCPTLQLKEESYAGISYKSLANSVLHLLFSYRNMPSTRHPFLHLIVKTSVKIFVQLWVHLKLATFLGTITKNPTFIVHFLPFLKTVRQHDHTLKQTSFGAITNKFGLAQQDKIGLEMSASLYASIAHDH